MTVRELREKYLAFFATKGHHKFPSGSLIPFDVTGRLDESLLFNGAGMIQFKPYFRGTAVPDQRRLMTAQKCVRTGDIEEVGDDTHLTFFEMMGNFSFGDYFKAEVIGFSWEFLTSPQWLNLDPNRLAFSVYEDDDDAVSEWTRWLSTVGIDPSKRIFRLSEESNYWPAGALTKGPPGPCGPNSEMFYWTGKTTPPGARREDPAYGRDEFLVDDAKGNWVEIWNDVFITYDWQGDPAPGGKGHIKTGMPELPFRSVDTGMGLERTALVLGGYDSVYDIDVFAPIFSLIRELTLQAGEQTHSAEAVQVAERIVADHIRTATFCIADGVLPSNTGRGYVLRRLIRRAVLKGDRVLGLREPFLYRVFAGVEESMGHFYTELGDRRVVITETLRNEEDQFRKTLEQGSQLLLEHIDGLKESFSRGQAFSGPLAFQLYDTFGFPLEITQEIVAEYGGTVDVEGYEQAMTEAQARSRGAQEREAVYGQVGTPDWVVPDAPATTEFLGYLQSHSDARIVRIRPVSETKSLIALDRTPFYAESGGQAGDSGHLTIDGVNIPVANTSKSTGIFWHSVPAVPQNYLGKSVSAVVDARRRARTQRNHTATHLLHAALRQTLGEHVTQAGSAVGPDGLRFDFTHGAALTDAQRSTVEGIVNQQALLNEVVKTYVDIPIAEARERGAMALFGEKYGDRVRMVEIGNFSRELCGGTHVRTSSEIGMFKIVSESSAAGGVRRIEGITGEAAYAWACAEDQKLRTIAGLLKSTSDHAIDALEKTIEQLRDERKRRERAELAALSGTAAAGSGSETVSVNGVALWRRNFGAVDSKTVSTVVDNTSAANPGQVTLAASVFEGKITFIAKVGSEAMAKGAHAGNLIREVAKIAGGGGGGKAEFATAGGKDETKVEEALQAAEGLLAKMVQG